MSDGFLSAVSSARVARGVQRALVALSDEIARLEAAPGLLLYEEAMALHGEAESIATRLEMLLVGVPDYPEEEEL